MNELVVIILGQNCERFIEMSLDSVKDADVIIYCDGGSTDGTIDYLLDKGFRYDSDELTESKWEKERRGGVRLCGKIIIENPYDQEDPKMNGKQRNFYLDYLKKHRTNDWCLVLDADEVVEDLNKIKEFIQNTEDGLYSVKMRHLIQDLSHEDSVTQEHFVPNRLFKISESIKYPEVEHPVLEGQYKGNCISTTIWHLAYIPNLWEIKKRYDNHMKKSNMHTPEFLNQWYRAHLFGTYPKKQFNPVELPSVILNHFGINKDELYFANRGLEHKHWIDAIHWRDFFKCESAIEVGCGRGPRVFAMNQVGIDTDGFELSEFAVNNKLHQNVFLGDITKIDIAVKYNLVIAYDLLEHINYEDLSKVLDNLIKLSDKHILISVPVIGDPNLELDSTHIIKETKEWWIKQFANKGLKLVETPNHFLFKEQLMIFSK